MEGEWDYQYERKISMKQMGNQPKPCLYKLSSSQERNGQQLQSGLNVGSWLGKLSNAALMFTISSIERLKNTAYTKTEQTGFLKAIATL